MANQNFLIAGLGNIGSEYEGTRHNIGFMIVDALAKSAGVEFEDKRYGFVATMPLKGNKLYLLKPSTYMNLSGNAVRYWLQQKKIAVENLLVAVDDLSLPFGKNEVETLGKRSGTQWSEKHHVSTGNAKLFTPAFRNRQRFPARRSG